MLIIFNDKVLSTIKKYKMIKGGETVTVAISGGADSVALLHVLHKLQDELDIKLNAVHINHCLRGDESDRDEKFTIDFCKQLGIELKVFRVDIRAALADTKMGIEEGAREIRYRLLQDFASNDGIIATAHTQNDAAETLILNIVRGCGIKGICSIPAVRKNIIRPLIELSRENVEQYITDNGLSYVTDSSNLSDDYNRNKIRHNIIPELCKINPSFLNAASRLSSASMLATDYIEKQAKELINKDVTASELANLDIVLINEYIWLRCADELGICCEQLHIDKAREVIISGVGACQLPKNNILRIENDKVLIGVPADNKAEGYLIDFCIGDMVTPYKTYRTYLMNKDNLNKKQKINKMLFKNTLDYDKIDEIAFLRSRQEGDSIRLLGRGCTKSLKKLFCEEKIPIAERNKIAVLSCGNEILWIENFGASEYASVSDNTKNVLVIEPISN